MGIFALFIFKQKNSNSNVNSHLKKPLQSRSSVVSRVLLVEHSKPSLRLFLKNKSGSISSPLWGDSNPAEPYPNSAGQI